MSTVIGTLLFAVAVTLFTWSALQYRQPVLANWTGNTYATMALALTSVVSLILAGAFYSQSYFSPEADGLLSGTIVAVASIAILCAGVFAMRRMILQWRDLIRGRNAFGADLTAANDSGPSQRRPIPGAPNGSKPRRRKAA
tara:strand:+ start:218 stop:640 length:423 start_codon:yes stop_codon:yes gene_type:complete